MSANCEVIVTFLIYAKFGAFQKPYFRCILCKTYISINGNLLSYKNLKQNWKISNTALTLFLWIKVLSVGEMLIVLWKKTDLGKIRKGLVLTGIFSETTYVCVFT